MVVGSLNSVVTFQRTDNRRDYTDVLTCRAYINGVSGSEFFIANAGSVGSLVVTVTCRYQPALMQINPNNCRIVDDRGQYYELLSPADDKQSRHIEVIFRARRLMKDGQT